MKVQRDAYVFMARARRQSALERVSDLSPPRVDSWHWLIGNLTSQVTRLYHESAKGCLCLHGPCKTPKRGLASYWTLQWRRVLKSLRGGVSKRLCWCLSGNGGG